MRYQNYCIIIPFSSFNSSLNRLHLLNDRFSQPPPSPFQTLFELSTPISIRNPARRNSLPHTLGHTATFQIVSVRGSFETSTISLEFSSMKFPLRSFKWHLTSENHNPHNFFRRSSPFRFLPPSHVNVFDTFYYGAIFTHTRVASKY